MFTAFLATVLCLAAAVPNPAIVPPIAPDPLAPPERILPQLPTIFVVSDSTAARDSGDVVGWGVPFPLYFDLSKVNVVNRARGGRSSRTFLTQGFWAGVLADLKSGDYVLLQMGHNDSSKVNDTSRARGSLPGLGDESQSIENLITHRPEVVHTFGWYMGKLVDDTRAKGAHPILLSPTVHNLWSNGQIERGIAHYPVWTAQLAEARHVPYVDLTGLLVARFEAMGQQRVAPLFHGDDRTHTVFRGAEQVAFTVVEGLRQLPGNPLGPYILPSAE